MLKVLERKIDQAKILGLQVSQYQNALFITGEVPKASDGGALNGVLNVSNIGDFLCQRITGKFSTKVFPDDTVLDSGTCALSVKVKDRTNGTDLFDDFIPLDLFLTPGRVRTQGVVVDEAGGVPNPSNALFFPMPFEYLFLANTEIEFDFRNTATYANTFSIALWGIRLRRGMQNRNV